MRLEATKTEGEYKVWLTDGEIESLRRAAASYRDDLIIQLGAYVGLRAFEIPQVTPGGISETDGGQYRLRIPRGKDTTGSGGKPRDADLPTNVERNLRQYQNIENIAPRDPFIDLFERGIRAVVKRTAESASDDANDEDFRFISSHDLRRRFAQRLLVDENMNPRVVMQTGGWDSFEAIEPYLTTPTPKVVDEAFGEIDF